MFSSPLSNMWFASIFSWSVACLLIFLIESLAEDKVFVLKKSSVLIFIFIFFFMDHAFDVISKNSSLSSRF